MIPDALMEHLVPNTFGVLGYVCVVVHFICGLIFTAITARFIENGKLSCWVDIKSTATYKKLVDQVCLTQYNQTYSPHLPLYGFVLLSIGLLLLISGIYSLTVRSRVSEIKSIQETPIDGNESLNYGKRTVYVFNCYIIHLAARLLIGIVVTALQHKYFDPNGFDAIFICTITAIPVICEPETAFNKQSLGVTVLLINIIVAFVILIEVIYLCQRGLRTFNCDTQFVTEYFLRKQYAHVDSSQPLTSIECKYVYKQQILSDRRTDFYIKLVIKTERAPHKVPPDSIELKEVKHLFDPNGDTNWKSPRSILAFGRPGMGKTALTEKIRRDWAEASDQVNLYYRKKIVFLFQLKSFYNSDKFTLKNFLQFGTTLNSEKFSCIYDEVITNPEAAIMIFDGLDKLRTGSPTELLNKSRMIPNDPNTEISVANLFVKLVLGDMLNGATVVVTGRPTAAEFYSILKFDRRLEIIGFTSEKIEEYVRQFCEKENMIEYKAKIWEQIHSSPELLNLCHNPGTSFIVCVTLSGCLHNDDDVLPTTLTELYKNAFIYLEMYDKTRNTEMGLLAETIFATLLARNKQNVQNETAIACNQFANHNVVARLVRFTKKLCEFYSSIGHLHCGDIVATCMLISQSFIATNHHVVDDIKKARKSSKAYDYSHVFVNFDYESSEGHDHSKCKQLKDINSPCNITNQDLDFAFLYLEEPVEEREERFALGKLVKCEVPDSGVVCIVGHPAGREKQDELCYILPLHDNSRAIELDQRCKEYMGHRELLPSNFAFTFARCEEFMPILQQLCSDEGRMTYDVGSFFEGSSGSAVFDMKCNIVVLHCGGFRITDIYRGSPDGTSIVEYAVTFAGIISYLNENGHAEFVEEHFPNAYLEEIEPDKD